MDIQITADWAITLPGNFEHRIEGNHLILWTTGITLLNTVYSYSGEKGREQLLANLRAKAEAEGLETIYEEDGRLIRFGYLRPEQIKAGHHRLALHAFTTGPANCLHASFYLDQASDLELALLAWKSARLLTGGLEPSPNR